MIIYVIMLNNKQNGERHLERVAFTNEDDAFDYCNRAERSVKRRWSCIMMTV